MGLALQVINHHLQDGLVRFYPAIAEESEYLPNEWE